VARARRAAQPSLPRFEGSAGNAPIRRALERHVVGARTAGNSDGRRNLSVFPSDEVELHFTQVLIARCSGFSLHALEGSPLLLQLAARLKDVLPRRCNASASSSTASATLGPCSARNRSRYSLNFASSSGENSSECRSPARYFSKAASNFAWRAASRSSSRRRTFRRIRA
jgi:hypothetical protein